MSVCQIHACELAAIATFARGVADPRSLLVALAAANVRACVAEYPRAEPLTPVTEADLAAEPSTTTIANQRWSVSSSTEAGDTTLMEAMSDLTFLACNCVTYDGTDHRTASDHAAFVELGRALLAEEKRRFGNRLRRHGHQNGARLRRWLDVSDDAVSRVAASAPETTRGGEDHARP